MAKETEKDLGKTVMNSVEIQEDSRSLASVEALQAPDRREAKERSRESELTSVDHIRDRLLGEKAAITASTRGSIVAYLEKNLPERFRETQFFAGAHQKVSSMIFRAFNTLGLFKIRGREHIPSTGECILVSNHTRFFDESKIFALLNRPAHILGADMHFGMSPIHRWFMNKIGAIEVRSTLGNLSEEEKNALLERTPKGARAYYQKVIDRDREPMNATAMRSHRETLQSTIAVLLKGEPVILFPEGLWLYEGGKEGEKMRKAYGGIEHIAREYRRLTGKELPIVPVGITKGSATAGESVVLGEGQSVHDVMRKIAELLPEDERGYYGKTE